MHLRELIAVNFRSYAQLSVRFAPGLNALVGANGAGKTNVLDMVYYLCMCKPSQGGAESSVVRHDATGMSLFGRFAEGEEETRVGVAYHLDRALRKQLSVNDAPCDRMRDHFGRIPLAVIYPNDALLLGEGGDQKRRFMNFAIAQYDADYALALSQVAGVLGQRNKHLKQGCGADSTLLEAYDAYLVPASERVYRARQEFCHLLEPIFQSIYQVISDSAESVGLAYQSSLAEGDYGQMLREAMAHDRQRMHTTVGVHRDSIEFTINGYTASREGSQGQQKSFVIALRLAQHQLLQKHSHRVPILLLDDLLDRLDAGRARRLLAMLSGDGYGQVFLTHCDGQEASRLLQSYDGTYNLYTVESGRVILQE